MTGPEEIDYTVIMVFPGFGEERENAEAIVESALEWLNTYKDEPGFRFGYNVSAHLEIVSDALEARERIDADDSVGMLILHDLDENERNDLLRYARAQHIAGCYTVDVPRQPGPRKGPWKVVFGKPRPPDEVPAHTLCGQTLTNPVAEDDETGGRVGELIAVMALGVMDHHYRLYPPQLPPP
jgi:hypothetical protein